LPQRLPLLTDEQFREIKDTYSSIIDVDDIDAEVDRWRYKFRNTHDVAPGQYGLEFCVEATKNLYPNLHSILLLPATTE
jgi:hypothetical protein